MKYFLKSVLLVLPFITVSFLASIGEANTELPPAYSITVETKPACYGGTCHIQNNSTLAVYTATSTGSSYFYNGSGLGPGTYTVRVCCEGMYALGTVTLNAPYDDEYILLELVSGQCPDFQN